MPWLTISQPFVSPNLLPNQIHRKQESDDKLQLKMSAKSSLTGLLDKAELNSPIVNQFYCSNYSTISSHKPCIYLSVYNHMIFCNQKGMNLMKA